MGSTRGWSLEGPRQRQVTIHLSEGERQAIGRIAERMGMRPGAWVAEIAVRQARGQMEPIPADWRDVVARMMQFRSEVSRSASAVEQLMQHADTTGELEHGADRVVAVSERLLQRVDAAIDQAGVRQGRE